MTDTAEMLAESVPLPSGPQRNGLIHAISAAMGSKGGKAVCEHVLEESELLRRNIDAEHVSSRLAYVEGQSRALRAIPVSTARIEMHQEQIEELRAARYERGT